MRTLALAVLLLALPAQAQDRGVRDEISSIQRDAGQDKVKRSASLKAQRIQEALPALPYTWADGRYEITVQSFRLLPSALEATLAARRDASPVSLDNPYVFVNPPVLVPDPAGNVDLGTRGKYREDLLGAFRSMVGDAVRARR